MKNVHNTRTVEPDGTIVWTLKRYVVISYSGFEILQVQVRITREDYQTKPNACAYVLRGARKKLQYNIAQLTA